MEQWGGIKHGSNNQSGYDVRSGSRNLSNIWQCPRIHTTKNSTHQNVASTIKDPNSDQQLSCTLSCNKTYPYKKNKGGGNSFPQDKVSRLSRELQLLLETGQIEIRWLLHKATPSVPSHSKEIRSVYINVSTTTISNFKSRNNKERMITNLSPTTRVFCTGWCGSGFKSLQGCGSWVKSPRSKDMWDSHHRDLSHELTTDQQMKNILLIRLEPYHHDQWITLGLERADETKGFFTTVRLKVWS